MNRERLEALKNNLIITKEDRLEDECSKGEYQPPCSPTQVCNRIIRKTILFCGDGKLL